MIPLDTCKYPDTNETLRQLWAVLSDRHSVNQIDRQLLLMDVYLSVTEETVKLADLQLLTRVAAFLAPRAVLESRYIDPLQRIINILKRPFKMEKASEEVSLQHYLVEFFSTIGCLLLHTKSINLRSDLLEVVNKVVFAPREENSDLIPMRACVKAIEVSQFVECLVDLMAIAEEDIYHLVIFTALQISLVSKLCCWANLMKNANETLLVRLTTVYDERRSEVLDITFQLMWVLFRCTNHLEDWEKVSAPSMIALRSLRYVLREEALLNSYPGPYSSGLNNIAALTLKIMQLFPTAEYLLSGLAADITFFATLSECVIQIHILPHFKNSLQHVQFKKLMLACLSLCPISSGILTIFDQYRIGECLVALITGGISYGSSAQFSPEDMIDLFKCALPVVCALFVHIQNEFIKAGLITKLVMFLKVHYFSEKHLPDELALAVIRTISFLCFCEANVKTTCDSLKEADTVPVLLNLIKLILEHGGPLTTRSEYIIHLSLCVLARLMDRSVELQISYSETSLYIVSTLYQRIIKPLPKDSLFENKLIVAVSNFAWEAFVLSKENVLMFIKSGNIFSHLDILERSPFSVQTVYLSVLADLCQHEQCVPYLVSWRGRQGVKLVSLLCKIWRAEEERLEVPRDSNGCISDIERPLMGKKQIELMQKENTKPISMCDVYGSCRPKIYAIVQLLHRHKEVKTICEEHYKLGHDKLASEDLLTMQIVESYLSLKIGEVWFEIRNKQDKVLPLDRYLAETLADRYLRWSISVQIKQHEILKSLDAHLKQEELEFYSVLRSAHLTNALAALREVEFISRTTDRQLLLRSHQRLQEGIESSRAFSGINFKIAYPHELNTILVNSQTEVVVHSEPELHSDITYHRGSL